MVTALDELFCVTLTPVGAPVVPLLCPIEDSRPDVLGQTGENTEGLELVILQGPAGAGLEQGTGGAQGLTGGEGLDGVIEVEVLLADAPAPGVGLEVLGGGGGYPQRGDMLWITCSGPRAAHTAHQTMPAFSRLPGSFC